MFKTILILFVSISLGIYLRKDRNNEICNSMTAIDDDIRYVKDLSNKNVLLTGANGLNSLGFYTALELLKRDANLLITTRSIEKCKETEKLLLKQVNQGKLNCGVLELSSLNSVKEFASTVQNKRIDFLVLNAAIVRIPFMSSEDGFELQWAVNTLGHFYLVFLLIPNLLKASLMNKNSNDKNRIVFVSSQAAYFKNVLDKNPQSYIFDELNEYDYEPGEKYARSKLGNVLVANALNELLFEFNILAVSIHPGVILSDASRHILPDQYKFILPIARVIVKKIGFKSLIEGTQTSLFAILHDDFNRIIKHSIFLADCKMQAQTFDMIDSENIDFVWKLLANQANVSPELDLPGMIKEIDVTSDEPLITTTKEDNFIEEEVDNNNDDQEEKIINQDKDEL